MTEEQRSYLAQRIAGRSRTLQECSLRTGRESSSQQVQRERSRGKVGETHERWLNLTHSARVLSLLRKRATTSLSLVRNPYSAEADSDVFTLEDWAVLYK